jgi:hypothetical protein
MSVVVMAPRFLYDRTGFQLVVYDMKKTASGLFAALRG